MSARSCSPKASNNSDTKRDLLERFIPPFSDYPTLHYKELPGSATRNRRMRGITMCLGKNKKGPPEQPKAVKPEIRAKITVKRGPRPHLCNRPASGPRGWWKWEWGCWAASHRPTCCVLAQLCTCPALRPRTEPEVSNRDVSSLMDMGPYTSEARSWSNTTPLGVADRYQQAGQGNSLHWGWVWGLLVIGESHLIGSLVTRETRRGTRLSPPQLEQSLAAVWGKYEGRSVLWASCRWSRTWSRRRCTNSNRIVIANGLTIQRVSKLMTGKVKQGQWLGTKATDTFIMLSSEECRLRENTYNNLNTLKSEICKYKKDR